MERIEYYKFSRTTQAKLGEGSFSEVYLGIYEGPDNYYIKNNTKVAIKIINLVNMDERGQNVLNDEISIMEMIKVMPHPNIVGCYDVIKRKSELYIVLEYCDSGDLHNILKKPMLEKYAQFYFCQLANGLRYLDKHSIIHRDIKPKNILLTNNRKVLKIADFGFAKKIRHQSLHDTICGSPYFMSPEIISGNRYNNQTDLWSIGMILYVMLYGYNPFGVCKTIPQLKDMLSKTIIEIPPLNTKNKNVTDECIMLLKHLLQKKVDERINWDDFFEHPWVKKYQYEVPITNKRNEEYEKQLYSTSVGSVGCIPKEDDSATFFKSSSFGSTPQIKTSYLGSLTIDENFCDQLDNNATHSVKEKQKISTSYSPQEEFLFEMDFDEPNKNKSNAKKTTDNLKNEETEYEIIDKH